MNQPLPSPSQHLLSCQDCEPAIHTAHATNRHPLPNSQTGARQLPLQRHHPQIHARYMPGIYVSVAQSGGGTRAAASRATLLAPAAFKASAAALAVLPVVTTSSTSRTALPPMRCGQ